MTQDVCTCEWYSTPAHLLLSITFFLCPKAIEKFRRSHIWIISSDFNKIECIALLLRITSSTPILAKVLLPEISAWAILTRYISTPRIAVIYKPDGVKPYGHFLLSRTWDLTVTVDGECRKTVYRFNIWSSVLRTARLLIKTSDGQSKDNMDGTKYANKTFY